MRKPTGQKDRRLMWSIALSVLVILALLVIPMVQQALLRARIVDGL